MSEEQSKVKAIEDFAQLLRDLNLSSLEIMNWKEFVYLQTVHNSNAIPTKRGTA